MCAQAGVFRTAHHRAQKDGFKVAAVIGQMAMGLAERRHDLRHFQTELAFCIRQRGAMAMRIALLTFCRVRPDLNALTRQWRAVASTAHSA